MLTYEQVFEIFSDYLQEDTAVEVVLTKRGYLRILWAGSGPHCDDDILCHTPEELFDLLLGDCLGFHEAQRTQGRRELTEEDIAWAKERCRPYLEKRWGVEGT